jgi:acetyltransferase-like isoleucine patch superfamily enzyme
LSSIENESLAPFPGERNFRVCLGPAGDVTIGKGAVIAAGAVVVKGVPEYEVWRGVPAKKIKDRPDKKES